MKARPILFSGPLVRALLEDRKTQTRRVVKWPKSISERDIPEAVRVMNRSTSKRICERGPCDGQKLVWSCPYGKPGDLLWVRETFEEVHPLQVADGRYSQEGQAGIPGPPGVTYRVIYHTDGEYPRIHSNGGGPWPYRVLCKEGCTYYSHEGADGWNGWQPSIFMPRWASRLTLRIKAVRVEYLGQISEADALKEGYAPDGAFVSARAAFLDGDWARPLRAANPLVWVIEFDVIRANVDAVLQEAA